MTIDPISAVPTHAFSESVRAARRAGATAETPPAAGGDSGRLDAIPSSPPPDVFASMLTAARAADRLAAHGRALHFSTDETSGLSVQLTDLDGTVLGTVAPSTVLSVAEGGEPD